jgi:hypothetical protein
VVLYYNEERNMEAVQTVEHPTFESVWASQLGYDFPSANSNSNVSDRVNNIFLESARPGKWGLTKAGFRAIFDDRWVQCLSIRDARRLIGGL